MAKSAIPADLWKQAEEIYPEGGVKAAIALFKSHGIKATHHQVRTHMSSRQIGYRNPAAWSEKEIELLEKHSYLTYRALQSNYFPHRTVSAIKDAFNRHGVTRAAHPNLAKGGHQPTLAIPPFPTDVEVRVVVLGDQQIPELHYPMHRAVLHFLADYLAEHDGPTFLINLGDLFSANRLGRFPVSPDLPDVREEVVEAIRVLEDYELAAGPTTKHVLVEGNHEYRLAREGYRNPQLGVMVRPLRELLEADRLGIEHVVPYDSGVVEFADSMLFEHGHRVSRHSAYTAKANVEDRGWSVITGHTHRLGVHYKRLYDKTIVGLENGTLAVDQTYTHLPNWQRGFTYFRFWGSAFWFHQVYAPEGKFWAEGRHYGG